MPYRRCPTCHVLSYAPRTGGAAICPECGVPPPRDDATHPSPDTIWRLGQLLRMTRDLLDTEVAVLTEIRDGREIAHHVDGKMPGRTSFAGASLELEHTFCQRMLDGRIGNYICDARTDARVNDLAMARQLGVRAWLGVPIELSDLRLYVLCCLASQPRPSIGAAEVRLLAGLAESVRAELQAGVPVES